MCGSRKYPYPHPPQMIIGNSEGEGGFEGSNFQGVVGGGGVHGKLLFQVLNNLPNIERKSLDLKHKNILTYIVLKHKSVLLSTEMSFNVCVFL